MTMVAVGHWLFAAGLALSWVNSGFHIVLSDRPVYLLSARAFQGRVRSLRLGLVLAASVPYAALLWLFVSGAWPEWTAIGILSMLIGIRRREIADWPDNIVVRLGKYVPAGACLTAWLVAQPFLRWAGHSGEEAHERGWQASCGVLAGAYVLAAIAKLRESGPAWVHPRYQALLVAERGFHGPRILRRFRLAIARSPHAARIVGLTGFWVGALAFLYLVPALRPFVLAVVIALHIGFVVLLGYAEPEWVIVMIAVTARASEI